MCYAHRMAERTTATPSPSACRMDSASMIGVEELGAAAFDLRQTRGELLGHPAHFAPALFVRLALGVFVRLALDFPVRLASPPRLGTVTHPRKNLATLAGWNHRERQA